MIRFAIKKSAPSLFGPLNLYTVLQDSHRLRTFQRPQEKQIPPIPQEIFDQALLLTLVRLQGAFQKLKASQVGNNSIKQINLIGVSKLEVQSNVGWFLFAGEAQLSTFFYTSPFNGPFKYYYDLDSKSWVSNKDAHILEQNLAREIQGKFYAYLDI